MLYTHLGRTGLQVSRLCLGTMNFGSYAPETDSYVIMDQALDFGINFFDTANVYGGDMGRGATEEIIGRWLSQGGRRERIVLATKVYGRTGTGMNDGRLSAYHIKRACEDSLRRLNTDHIDLYQMHHVDRDTPWEEVWQAMDQLVTEGKIIYVGSSNFAAWHIAQANAVAQMRNSLGLVSEQSIYNLRNRHVELEVLPACSALGVGVVPWSPLGGGILCGVLDGNIIGRRARPQLQESIEKLRPQLEEYEALCKKLETEPADIALAWVLNNPAVSSAIIGPRTITQLERSVNAMEIQLSEETLKELDRIWPGPGGPAPEAYSW